MANACSSRSASRAFLLRYCTAHAPPSSAAAIFESSTRVSPTSGVTAYKPRSRRARARLRSDGWSVTAADIDALYLFGGLLRTRFFFVARPEQAIGNVLAHTGPKRLRQRLPRVVLRLAHGVGKRKPVREHRGDCRGERASGAVI